MRVSKISNVSRLRHPYTRRLLSNLIGRDPNRVFASTPAELRRLVRELTRNELIRRPARGKWPIAWIVHHLADTEVGFAFRIRLAMAESGAPFQPFDQDRWARGLGYNRRSVASSIATFTALRRSHVELLTLSTRGELGRFGVHEERGRENIERMIHMLAGHDINHLRRIRAIRGRLGRKNPA